MENKKELNNHQMEDVSGGSSAIYGDNVDGKNPLGRKPKPLPTKHTATDSAQKWMISPASSEKK